MSTMVATIYVQTSECEPHTFPAILIFHIKASYLLMNWEFRIRTPY